MTTPRSPITTALAALVASALPWRLFLPPYIYPDWALREMIEQEAE